MKQEREPLKAEQRDILIREGLIPENWIRIKETMADFTVIRKGTDGKKPEDRREFRW